jgi:hypothetical protein
MAIPQHSNQEILSQTLVLFSLFHLDVVDDDDDVDVAPLVVLVLVLVLAQAEYVVSRARPTAEA